MTARTRIEGAVTTELHGSFLPGSTGGGANISSNVGPVEVSGSRDTSSISSGRSAIASSNKSDMTTCWHIPGENFRRATRRRDHASARQSETSRDRGHTSIVRSCGIASSRCDCTECSSDFPTSSISSAIMGDRPTRKAPGFCLGPRGRRRPSRCLLNPRPALVHRFVPTAATR